MGNAMRTGTNIFYSMDAVHIQQVFDELSDRFGFPEKQWTQVWKEHLDQQPKNDDDISCFLRFGYERINPILNGLLLRGVGSPTFSNLCEYVIKRSMEKKYNKP